MNLTLLVAPEGRLGTYMGVVSAATLVGPAFGPIAGGILLSVAGWHFLFVAFAVVFIAFMAVFAMNILLPLYMENALGFSAFDAALTLLIPCLSCVIFAPAAGHRAAAVKGGRA